MEEEVASSTPGSSDARTRWSLAALIVANVAALVVFLGTEADTRTVLLAYWLETGVVGAYAILSIIPTVRLGAFFFVPFFMFHMGVFMAVHLVFILGLTGGFDGALEGGGFFSSEQLAWGTMAGVAGILTVSHGASAVLHRPRRATRKGPVPVAAALAGDQASGQAVGHALAGHMTRPYVRILAMQFTLVLGGVILIAAGEPLLLLVLLVAAKTLVDGMTHAAVHNKGFWTGTWFGKIILPKQDRGDTKP